MKEEVVSSSFINTNFKRIQVKLKKYQESLNYVYSNVLIKKAT